MFFEYLMQNYENYTIAVLFFVCQCNISAFYPYYCSQILIIMKAKSIRIPALIVCMALFSCSFGKTIRGNGNIVTREFHVGQFNEIELCLPATVNYRTGSQYSCVVKVDENILDYLSIKTVDGDLELNKVKKHRSVNLQATQFVIEITSPSLKGIDIAGSGDVYVLNSLTGKEMSVNIAGSGDVIFKEPIAMTEFDAEIAGSGDVKITKHSEFQKIDAEIAGSGDVFFVDANVLKVDVEVAGSGNVTVSGTVKDAEIEIAGSGDVYLGEVVGSLQYGIAGSGDIYYSGSPTVRGSKMGSGDIHKR